MRSIVLLLLISVQLLSAQPNCNYFKLVGDTLQYKACLLMEEGAQHYQFTREAFEYYDQAIAVCPYHAEAYYEKGVVYLKAGNFIKWREYMDKAVELNPKEFLGIRAACDAKFWGDFHSAIADIDRLDALVDYDIGHIHDGSYHLDAYKALCYKNVGDFKKAIDIFENHIAMRPDLIGDYDFLHLGVCYLELGTYEKAIFCFNKQSEINEMAENQYYLSLAFKGLNKDAEYIQAIKKAESLYLKDLRFIDGFHTMNDQVFLQQILEEKKMSAK